jgi:hypothetical protein
MTFLKQFWQQIFQTMMQQEEFTCDNKTGAPVVTGACLLARTKSLVVFNGMQLQIVDVDAAKKMTKTSGAADGKP